MKRLVFITVLYIALMLGLSYPVEAMDPTQMTPAEFPNMFIQSADCANAACSNLNKICIQNDGRLYVSTGTSPCTWTARIADPYIPIRVDCTPYLNGQASTTTDVKVCFNSTNNTLYYVDSTGTIHASGCSLTYLKVRVNSDAGDNTNTEVNFLDGAEMTFARGGTPGAITITPSLVAGMTRDTEWDTQAEVEAVWGTKLTTVVRLTGDVSNSTLNFADITGLSFSAAANKDYLIEARLIVNTAATTTGILLGANGPASPTAISGYYSSVGLSASTRARTFNIYDHGVGAWADFAFTTDNMVTMSIVFRNGANAGTFILRFASEVDTSAITIKTGSILTYQQTN